MNSGLSLDQRYLHFVASTSQVFAQYPRLEPLRHLIFKELLAQQKAMGWKDVTKHWLRPLLRRSRSGTPDRADVIIWIESAREVIVDSLLPVYRELASRDINVGLVSYGGPANLPSPALQFQHPASALTPAWAKDAWDGLYDVVAELRNEPLRSAFYYACAGNEGLLNELERVLEAVNPKVVINASMQLVGGASLVVASRSRGALTLLLQHGIVQPFYTPLVSDYMLTWGELSNDTLVRLCVPPQRLIALGSPRHDSMRPLGNGSSRASLLQALLLQDRPTFVFFSNGNDLVRNSVAPLECAKWLETTAALYADQINIVIRLHPNEDGSLYRNFPHLHITKGSPDLATILDGCDWVGSLCSTVLHDALIYRKPVWQFSAPEWPELADNWKYGLATRISSQDELSGEVHSVLVGGVTGIAHDKEVARVFANHGRAAEAVADFVECSLEGEQIKG